MTTPNYSWLNVLLVDDSQAILNYVSAQLEQQYQIHNIYQASSAAEAIQVLRQSSHFNVMFIDLNMPNMDGIQLLKQIKELGFQGYVVIMSGIATRIISSVEILVQKYRLNYIGTLVKPLHEGDFDKIFAKIGQSRPPEQQSQSLKTYEIIRALKDDNFKVLYQPQVSVVDRKLIGVEALCRLNHPRLGLVSPDRFIDKAEESELILHISMAVLRQAFKDWQKWRQMGLTINLSINISPSSLQQEEFVDSILSLLNEYQMPAQHLCLEITENVLANDKAQELHSISRLNMNGIQIALDDFGKNHATIDRLEQLPLNYVKLDKSYFIDFECNPHARSIINTSVTIAQRLNLKICAEGIETRSALQLATEYHCDTAQGYFISEPLPAKELIPWSKRWMKSL